jgi:osmotically-inducible protein OsmY
VNDYVEGQVQQLLAEDPRIAEQGIRVVRVDDGVVLVGEVESPDRCAQIESVVREAFPDLRVRCDLGITRVSAPEQVEQI